MLKIGEFSKLSRVSIRMLRHYDEIGLLNPIKTDPGTGYRYYGEEQLYVINKITSLKDMGFGLIEIREILDSREDSAMMEKRLYLKQTELQKTAELTAYRLRLLDTAIKRLRKDESMKYDVALKTLPERYAATVRMMIPSYDKEGMLWALLMKETAHMDLIPADPCYCCAEFLDKEFRESDVEVEVSKTVKGSYQDTEHVRFRVLPSVTAASTVCKGSYDQMGEIMAAVAQWVRDNGYEFDGPAFNIYHVSPHETSDPNEFVTEVCYPVKKK